MSRALPPRCARVFLVALTVVLAAACTGADDRDATDDAGAGRQQQPAQPDDGSPAATGDFATSYNAATERYAEALAEVQAAGVEAVASDPVGAHEVYEQLREVTEAARAELSALAPPDEVAEHHERIVRLFEEQAEILAGAVTASRARDDRSLESDLEHYASLLAAWREAHGALSNRLEGS